MSIIYGFIVWVVGFALIALALEHWNKPYK
jgi:uncharacterized membrane protein